MSDVYCFKGEGQKVGVADKGGKQGKREIDASLAGLYAWQEWSPHLGKIESVHRNLQSVLVWSLRYVNQEALFVQGCPKLL